MHMCNQVIMMSLKTIINRCALPSAIVIEQATDKDNFRLFINLPHENRKNIQNARQASPICRPLPCWCSGPAICQLRVPVLEMRLSTTRRSLQYDTAPEKHTIST